MAEKIGYYIVDLEVSTGLIGAPTLHLKLGVNAATGVVQGAGEITQPLPPPYGVTPIPEFLGYLHHTGIAKDLLLVYVQGEYLRGQVPHQIYPVIVTASLVVDASWNGTGIFTNGSHTYNDCTVTNVPVAAAPTEAEPELAVSSN